MNECGYPNKSGMNYDPFHEGSALYKGLQNRSQLPLVMDH